MEDLQAAFFLGEYLELKAEQKRVLQKDENDFLLAYCLAGG